MSKCKQCSFELDADAQYCPNCATKVDPPPQRQASSDAFPAVKTGNASDKAARLREEIRASLDAAIDASNRRIEKILSAPAVRSTPRKSTEFGLTMTCEACGGSGYCPSCREWYQHSSGENTCPDCGGTGECSECGGDGTIGDE